VKLGLIKLLQKQFDICEEAYVQLPVLESEADESVPTPTLLYNVPSSLRIAKFSVAVRGYTDEDADMLCLDLYVDFVSLSFTHTPVVFCPMRECVFLIRY
jgi:hypothetical protein